MTASIAHDADVAQRTAGIARSALQGLDDPAVQRFLRDHPGLVPLLERVPPAVERFFGPEVRLSLTAYRDPEASAHEELYALIHTSLAAPDALDRLAAFDEEWWLDALPEAGGKLTITLAAS